MKDKSQGQCATVEPMCSSGVCGLRDLCMIQATQCPKKDNTINIYIYIYNIIEYI